MKLPNMIGPSETEMKLLKGLLILALLSGMTMQVSASESDKEVKNEGSWILGGITIKRPPINDDGPGGRGGKGD